MRLECNAKINLGLFVTEKREDGFHNLKSIFLPIPWLDVIDIQESDEVVFSSSGIKIDGNGSQNLCLQAYHLLAKDFPLPPVSIHLEKNIPVGAGLGGGSSDAAFVLKGLNELFRLNLTLQQLGAYASVLGSDCPFFIQNKSAFVSGRGDQLNFELKLKVSAYCLVINPGVHISTATAYSAIKPQKAKFDLFQINNLDQGKWQQHIVNDFEAALLPQYPLLQKLKTDLESLNPFYVSMSGSGSTFFALFDEKPEKSNFGNYASKLFELKINQ